MSAVLPRAHDLPFLADCPLEDRQEFDAALERLTLHKGDVLIREGATDRALWLLLQGHCEVVKHGARGRDERVEVLESGAVCGELSFLKSGSHAATVRAITDVVAARLTPAAFQRIRESSPTAACCLLAHLATVLADRLRRSEARVCELASHAAVERQQEWQDFRARLLAGDFN